MRWCGTRSYTILKEDDETILSEKYKLANEEFLTNFMKEMSLDINNLKRISNRVIQKEICCFSSALPSFVDDRASLARGRPTNLRERMR